MNDQPVGFDISRAPDLSLVLGIACLAMYLFGCCIGAALGWLGLGPLACFAWTLGVVLGIVGLVFGKTGVAKIDAGELPEELRGRAKTGMLCNIAGLVLMALTTLAFVAMMFLGVGAVFMIPILESL